jgi:hypothetical protein
LQTIATLRTIGKHRLLVLKAGPGPNGTVCRSLVTPSGTSMGCGRAPKANSVGNVGPTQIGKAPNGWFLLDGRVGSNVRSLELRFQDGKHIAIPIHHGHILFQVNPRNFVSGHRPTELVARNSSGRVVDVRRFGFRP